VRRCACLAAAAAAFVLPTGTAVLAQAVVTSSAPEQVAVTLYRDPQRGPEQELRRHWLNGYALISESRTVTLPAGESIIRFEGVAGGIMPRSAIVTGLPEDIVERNRDAFLISPSTLLDRSLGSRVHLRRVSRATGEVREQEAVIRTGAGGAVVLQTAEGYETLRCTGLSETLVYDEVPAELSPLPTLSVRTRAVQPVTATITLSYLAGGFDWQANYIVYLSNGSARADLFAWLTMASVDETSFPDAQAQAVAGQVNRERREWERREGGALNLHCWPQYNTSYMGPLPSGFASGDDQTIYVTGSRVGTPNALLAEAPRAEMVATQEELGDLKLYRIPEPVTIAANSQKQVAFLQRQDVRVDILFRRRFEAGEPGDDEPTPWFLVTRNNTDHGLGMPLPAGRATVFATDTGRPILLGIGAIHDRAVGEEVEVPLGAAAGVTSRVVLLRETKAWREFALTVTNRWQRSIRFEAEFGQVGDTFRPGRRLLSRDGIAVWSTRVRANGTVRLRYRILR
jgi:hypothetical protein